MRYENIPSDDEVVAAVSGLRGNVTALDVCKVLERKHPRRSCQIAIQRAIERGVIHFRKDWSIMTGPAKAA